MNESPLVTVVICVYNAGQYLLSSVESVLAQTYSHLEILIVNDGSTDGCLDSLAHLSDSRVRIIHQENKGKPAAMNVALDQMRGEFYAISDADDLSAPNRIERQVACMQEYPDVAAVYCGYDLLMGARRLAPLAISKDRERCQREIAAMQMPSHDPTGMYRMSLVGNERYDTSLKLAEGFDYIMRVGERHPMMVVGEVLYTYRIHRESITKREPVLRDELVRRVRQRVCERRGVDFDHLFPAIGDASKERNKARDNNIAAHFISSVWGMRQRAQWFDAMKTGVACAMLHPLDPHYYKALVYAVAPMPFLRRVGRTAT